MKQILDKAAPFIKWLQEADEEESSDDEGVEVSSNNINIESLIQRTYLTKQGTQDAGYIQTFRKIG